MGVCIHPTRDFLHPKEENQMKNNKLELMDWKDMERGAEQQIANGLIDKTIGNIVLFEAQRKIIELGGETNEETDRKAKAQREEGEPILTK